MLQNPLPSFQTTSNVFGAAEKTFLEKLSNSRALEFRSYLQLSLDIFLSVFSVPNVDFCLENFFYFLRILELRVDREGQKKKKKKSELHNRNKSFRM